ncbi:MAG: WYL domain-containing protein [Leptospira sp.]|nr:WYL domain-containing protein [Leptospira sp.]
MNPKTLETASRLNLIRILSSAPNGLTLKELSTASGIHSEAELKASLGKLYMIGTYPYSPLDYIEVDYDGSVVRLLLGQNASKTIALTPKEWVILRNSLTKERQQYSEKSNEFKSIETAIAKIRSIVPFTEQNTFSEDKSIIQKAIRELKTISFQYIARDDEELETRTIDPWFLLEEINSYVLGYCHSRKSPRIFRLESIFELTITDKSFSKPNKKVTQKSLDEFKSFISSSKSGSEIAGIWHTRGSYYYLNQLLQLQTTDKTKVFNDKEFIYSTCAIQEKNWFLDIIVGFLPDVILESPTYLVEDFKGILNHSAI